MKIVYENVVGENGLETKNKIVNTDKAIKERVWICDVNDNSELLYSGCYIKKWYNFKPKLRLMTTNGFITYRHNKSI